MSVLFASADMVVLILAGDTDHTFVYCQPDHCSAKSLSMVTRETIIYTRIS